MTDFLHFTRQADSTHCVIYGSPNGELLCSYWPSEKAANAEAIHVSALGAGGARVESLALLDSIEGI